MNMQDREYLDAVVGGLKDVMEARFDTVGERFNTVLNKQDEMISHQKITNGRVTNLEDQIECVQKNARLSAWVADNPVKALGILLVAVFVIVFVAEQLTLTDILGLMK